MKVNGSTIANMEKEHTSSLSWLMDNKNSTNTLDNLKKDSIMEKELWSIGMVINMMVNGLLVKKKVKECMNGLMVIIMMAVGKKILLKVLELLVLAEFFMMENFIWVSNMVLDKRLMTREIQLKPCGKMEKS